MTLATAVAAWPLWSPRMRGRLLSAAGVRCDRVRVYPGIRLLGSPRDLAVGAGSFLNAELLVGGNARVEVGARVRIGPRCALLPTTHELGPSEQRAGAVAAAPIRIGDGCWLGAGVTVLSGVSIGAGAVIAAGAVVVGDCEPDALYAGVPARLVRRLEKAEAAHG